jgi:hypothetical protein
MTRLRVVVLAAVLLLGGPGAARAQVFFAARPDPGFEIGPLFVRAEVTAALGDVPIDIFFSLTVPANRSIAEQDLFVLWPSAIAGEAGLGQPDPALAKQVQSQGFTVLAEGRAPLFARNLYERGPDGRSRREPVAGGAPFVTFVREGGVMGLTSPATYLRIPWTPRAVNRAYIMDLRLVAHGLIKDKPGTWLERALWGPRHGIALSFADVRQRGMFPMYFLLRDRVVHLSEDPSQLIVNFTEADRLKIDEMVPPSARRQRSETLENTEVVSAFLDRSEGLRPQTLTVQFGYFSGLQAWAPVLVPMLFFVAGNIAGVLVRGLAERMTRRMSGRFHLGRAAPVPPVRESGTLVPRETLARVVPGETRYEDLARLIPGHPEEHERLESPGRKTLVYRGRRVVPDRKRTFGWLATVDHWDVETHEVEIELDHDVVSDVHARVRRSRATTPETAR